MTIAPQPATATDQTWNDSLAQRVCAGDILIITTSGQIGWKGCLEADIRGWVEEFKSLIVLRNKSLLVYWTDGSQRVANKFGLSGTRLSNSSGITPEKLTKFAGDITQLDKNNVYIIVTDSVFWQDAYPAQREQLMRLWRYNCATAEIHDVHTFDNEI